MEVTSWAGAKNLTSAQLLGGRPQQYSESMETSRFNGRSRQRSISRTVIGRYRKPIRMFEPESVGNVARSPQGRIFAIVSRPISIGVAGKTIRRVLIFDNHPESLRLVLQSSGDVSSDDAASRREKRASIICGSILIALVIAAMLWPLVW